MQGVVHASAPLFRAGWLVESPATQALVIFAILTADRSWASRPSPALTWGVGVTPARRAAPRCSSRS